MTELLAIRAVQLKSDMEELPLLVERLSKKQLLKVSKGLAQYTVYTLNATFDDRKVYLTKETVTLSLPHLSNKSIAKMSSMSEQTDKFAYKQEIAKLLPGFEADAKFHIYLIDVALYDVARLDHYLHAYSSKVRRSLTQEDTESDVSEEDTYDSSSDSDDKPFKASKRPSMTKTLNKPSKRTKSGGTMAKSTIPKRDMGRSDMSGSTMAKRDMSGSTMSMRDIVRRDMERRDMETMDKRAMARSDALKKRKAQFSDESEDNSTASS